MADMPDHITITVDENALREQVRRVLREEMRTLSEALHRAADAIDPSVIEELADFHREQGRREAHAALEGDHPNGDRDA